MAEPKRDTRAAATEVALELFTQQGYEATSMREIAERLGVTKAALYYHFTSKEELVLAMLDERVAELDALIAWTKLQPRTPLLLRDVTLRWLDTLSTSKLRGVRFAQANQATLGKLMSPERDIPGRLQTLVELIIGPKAPLQARVRAHLALRSINAVTSATEGLDLTEAELFESARALALVLTGGPAERGGAPGMRPATKTRR